MKKIILATVLVFCALQAEDTVHYDKRDNKKPEITKPNHPTTGHYDRKDKKKPEITKPNHPTTGLYTER